MNSSKKANNRLLTLGVLLFLTVIVIVIGQRSGLFRPLVSAVMAPLTPISGLLSDGTDAATGLTTEREDYETMRQRANTLEETVAQLQVEIVRLREIERVYERQQQIIDYANANTEQTLIAADVVARDTSSYTRYIIINRGTRDGVQIGDPVITGAPSDSTIGGLLVGRVEDVSATAAWVRLITDQNSTVNARLQTTRAEGTIIGDLPGELQMQFIPQDVEVEDGDIVLTSGLGGRFPAGILIGQVTNVTNQEAALFQQADIRPLIPFDDLETVAVITSFQPVEVDAFNDQIQEEEDAP